MSKSKKAIAMVMIVCAVFLISGMAFVDTHIIEQHTLFDEAIEPITGEGIVVIEPQDAGDYVPVLWRVNARPDYCYNSGSNGRFKAGDLVGFNSIGMANCHSKCEDIGDWVYAWGKSEGCYDISGWIPAVYIGQ